MHFNLGLKARRLSVETCWSAISTFPPFEWSRLFVILFPHSASWHRLTTTPPPPPPPAASHLNMLYALCVYNICILYIYTVLCIQAVFVYITYTLYCIHRLLPQTLLTCCAFAWIRSLCNAKHPETEAADEIQTQTINQLILQFEHGIQILARSVLLKISRWGKKKKNLRNSEAILAAVFVVPGFYPNKTFYSKLFIFEGDIRWYLAANLLFCNSKTSFCVWKHTCCEWPLWDNICLFQRGFLVIQPLLQPSPTICITTVVWT